MSGLAERPRADLNSARRERDKLRTLVLTMTLSEIKNRQIEMGREPTDEDVQDVVGRAIKMRGAAAEPIRAVGRSDLADKDEQEAALLMPYMPEQLSEDEVRQRVKDAIAAGANNVGAVMGRIMPKLK